MTTIVKMRFGSHLYGTATPASDLDIKAVHIPAWRDIMLQSVKPVISTNTKADHRARNTADDIDTESFAIQKFLQLCAQGQTVAVDMLFAPDWALIEQPDELWGHIQEHRAKLLTSQSASFVGYCRTQANKYGIRGSRVAAARLALALLDLHAEGATKLDTLAPQIFELVQKTEHMAIVAIPMQSGGEVLHWEVCGRKMPYTARITSARDIMQRVVDEYGHRALAAEQNQGIDWKAMSHAVRIAEQAIELLTTGAVTFPRPNAEFLISVKTGGERFDAISGLLDDLLIKVEAAAAASNLRAKADDSFVENTVIMAHARELKDVGL